MHGNELPRLLAGIGERPMTDLAQHLGVHGPLPELSQAEILERIERSGLRGHGGAAFPAAVKMRAVASRRKPKILVANGSEGEPASKKDRVLLRELPHLVLDGAAIAARAVGADQTIVAFSELDTRSADSLSKAAAQRGRTRGEPCLELVPVPERYLSGQESALVNFLSGGPGLPTFGPRPFERGVRQRPTLVQNVETLAHVALIARHGPNWFRQLGTEADPGSALVTISGAVASPGVYEIAHGTDLSAMLDAAGVEPGLSAVLVGGYFGSWLPASAIGRVRLSREELRSHGAALGAGVIVALGSGACPVAETARVADYFALQAAGQCGPCVNGLGAIADTLQGIVTGTAQRTAHWDLERWTVELRGRGACQHPDGAVRFVSSALHLFADEFRDHARRGRCQRCGHEPVLPVTKARVSRAA